MKILNRTNNLISVLLLGFISIGAIFVSLRFFSLDRFLANSNKMRGNLKTIVSSLVFLTFLFGLLFDVLLKNKDRKIVVGYNDLGDVSVSLKAVEKIMLREAKSVQGVKSAKVSVLKHHGKDGRDLIISKITISVDPKLASPYIAKEIKNNVLNAVHSVIGIEISNIKVYVENVSIFKKEDFVYES